MLGARLVCIGLDSLALIGYLALSTALSKCWSSVRLQSSMPFTGALSVGNGWRWCGLLAGRRLFSFGLDMAIT